MFYLVTIPTIGLHYNVIQNSYPVQDFKKKLFVISWLDFTPDCLPNPIRKQFECVKMKCLMLKLKLQQSSREMQMMFCSLFKFFYSSNSGRCLTFQEKIFFLVDDSFFASGLSHV